MLLEAFHGMVRDCNRRVIASVALDSRQWAIILEVFLRTKVAVLVLHPIRTIEPIFERLAIDVPFTGVIRAVSGGLQHCRQQARPCRSAPDGDAGITGNDVATNLLSVVSGQQRRASRPAPRCVVELCESQTILSQPI